MIKKISKIALGIMATFIMTNEVYGAKVTMEYVYKLPAGGTNESGNYRILKSKKDSEGNYKKLDKIILDNKYIAYCIDVEESLKSDDNLTQSSQTLEQYLNSKNVKNSKEVAKKINEYIYYGYKITDVASKENGEYYAATQQLIWETLSNAGYRTTEYNSVIPFRLTLKESETIDLTTEKNQILAKIKDHSKTPSFCSSTEKIELAVNETATYTDNNKVLSKYTVSCSSDLKCEKNENKLKVTVLKDGGEQKVTFTKSGDGKGTTLYSASGKQSVIINEGKVEPVSCTMGVDTYKNVQTSGIKTLAIVSIGMLFGLIAYIIYYKKENLNNL